MASRAVYVVVAVAGIAAASGAAWWYQHPKTVREGDAATAKAGSAPGGSGAAGSATSSKPPTVEAAVVQLARLADDAQAVGNLRSRRSVVLRPEVSGRITQLNFVDGQRVRKGQILVQFDDQLPLAQVRQAEAELSIAMANQKRNQELVAQNFISQRSVDESAANTQVAQAKLALAKATAARLRIVAPFDGIAGIRMVNVGDYLKDGADIVNLEDIDAVYVDFRLPERYQTKVKRGQTAVLDIDALPGRTYTAQIQAVDPLIDANGRSVGLRGCVDNRRLQLRPGMFARVNTVFGVRENARIIPEEALLPQGGKQFVIKLLEGPDAQTRIARRVEVKVGLRTPGKVEVTEGLEAGDTVVTAGQQRVQRDGMSVSIIDLKAGGPAPADGSPKPQGKAAAAGAQAAGKAEAPMQGNVTAATASPVEKAAASPAPAAKATGTKTAAPELAGPNPCGAAIAQAPAAEPTSQPAPPARKTAPPQQLPESAIRAQPATRNPA